MRFGRSVPRGFLPVFSVNTEEEANSLLVAACPRNNNREFIARELVDHQSLENLAAFGDRLRTIYQLMQDRKKR